MPSLFVETHPHGLAFYINGDLQFDTADEAIYHEHLAVPAIALICQRFPHQPLRILVCGGGDGLVVRDILRFPQVGEVALVDYDPEVVELGRTTFAPYNRGSLLDDSNAALGENRVTVHTREAFEFVAALPDRCYHAVICDFTFPTSSQATQVYSLEWFQQLKRILYSGGVMATNGVSPERNTTGFWCLYQTVLAAKLYAKPMQVKIPSFDRHDYGTWGFLLASEVPILGSELAAIALPNDLKGMQNSWRSTFLFSSKIAGDRHSVNIHTLEHPQLFYYLLNSELKVDDSEEFSIDFIDIQEAGSALISPQNPLQLESLVQVWLENQSDPCNAVQIHQLLPIQHHSHDSRMTTEWFGHLKSLLDEIDLKQLVDSLVDRIQELPPHLATELKQLKENLRTGQPIVSLSNQASELIVILSVTLLMASLAAPDAVFAKGSSYSNSGGSSRDCYDVDGSYTCSDGSFPIFGVSLLIGGGAWLWDLLSKPEE
ncbi:spermine/spermidine synthase domain-containing protein [Phormidesmis priestleyi]